MRRWDFHIIKAKQQTKARIKLIKAAAWPDCVMGQILLVTPWQAQWVWEDCSYERLNLACSLPHNSDCIYEKLCPVWVCVRKELRLTAQVFWCFQGVFYSAEKKVHSHSFDFCV